MKQETKEMLKGSVEYLRQLSVVVVGIALTFTVSDCIGKRNEQREVQRYLDAVKLELEDNLKETQKCEAYYVEANKLSAYLSSDKPEKLQLDTLRKYHAAFSNIFTVTYKTSAFEMLKSSGAMRLIEDKNFLRAIWDSYAKMEFAKNASDNYMQRKMDGLYNLLQENYIDERVNTGIADEIRKPGNKRLFNFYVINAHIDGVFRESSEFIQSALTQFPEE